MRIAQIAPLYESVPPKAYGGTERIVAYLTRGLIELGHEVTLFASGDSSASDKLIKGSTQALRSNPIPDDGLAYHLLQVEKALAMQSDFDILHWHIEYLPFSALRRSDYSTSVTTLHGRLDIPALGDVYREFAEMPLVSISMAQRSPLPFARWRGNVHHGLPIDLHRAGEGGEYLAFVGRIAPEKKVESAISIATKAKMPLKIAAKVDAVDRAYYEEVVRPLLKSPGVEFLGELDESAKGELLRNAKAMIFPIDWPEPFGLAMIESLACGTPVIARNRGSVPEVIESGVTGWIFDTDEEAVEAITRIDEISRETCRRQFMERFSARTMAENYLSVYSRLLDEKETSSYWREEVWGESRLKY